MCPSVHPSPCKSSPLSRFDNILLIFLLSRLLCGQGPQAICIINIVLSVIVRRELKCCHLQRCHYLSSVCYYVFFSPLKQKKRKVFLSLKLQKPKHRQYPSSLAVSHATVWCEWTENTSAYVMSECVYVLSEWVCLGRWVCNKYVHTLKICHFSL